MNDCIPKARCTLTPFERYNPSIFSKSALCIFSLLSYVLWSHKQIHNNMVTFVNPHKNNQRTLALYTHLLDISTWCTFSSNHIKFTSSEEEQKFFKKNLKITRYFTRVPLCTGEISLRTSSVSRRRPLHTVSNDCLRRNPLNYFFYVGPGRHQCHIDCYILIIHSHIFFLAIYVST